jgi:hypothetical protein
MDPTGLFITKHAIERFIARWPYPEQPICYLAALRRLLEVAIEEDIGIGRVVRLINNGLRPAIYMTADGWRFVFTEDGRRLLTCERIIFRARPKFQPKNRSRRRRR